MPDEPLTPMTEAEFTRAIAIAIAAGRARKNVRGSYTDGLNAKVIAESLWLGGLRPFKRPPTEAPPAYLYPGNHHPNQDDT